MTPGTRLAGDWNPLHTPSTSLTFAPFPFWYPESLWRLTAPSITVGVIAWGRDTPVCGIRGRAWAAPAVGPAPGHWGAPRPPVRAPWSFLMPGWENWGEGGAGFLGLRSVPTGHLRLMSFSGGHRGHSWVCAQGRGASNSHFKSCARTARRQTREQRGRSPQH